jgi:hypothetical protein
MLENLWTQWSEWWDTLSPAYLFLLSVPVVVIAVALVGDAARRPPRQRRRLSPAARRTG